MLDVSGSSHYDLVHRDKPGNSLPNYHATETPPTMATTVHTITISVADLEDGTYALILGEPTTHRVDEFNYRAADVYDGHSLAGYLADMTLSALGIDEEA